MKKLLIVDGSALLFQSFFGMPKKIMNHKGQYVEAVICFVGILLKTIKTINPDELIIVFDGENKLERQCVDSDYKANRQDFSDALDKDNPFLQLEIIKEVLTYLKFPWYETTNYEADDIIASIVNDYKSKYQIIISSSDKDFFQLIGDNVSVFVYRGKISKTWTTQEFKKKYLITPEHYSTYKALIGDASDNIKGVRGIGPVTASKIISKLGDLNKIFESEQKINEKIMRLLLENKGKIYNNYKIIELQSKTNLFNLEDGCAFEHPNKSSTSILSELNII